MPTGSEDMKGQHSLGPEEQLRRLQAVTDVALAHLATDELLGELVLRVREILEADTCAILLLDELRDELVARAAAGLEEEVEAGVRIPVGGGFAGRVAAERRVVAIEDVDHSEVLNPILREKGIKSLLGAPLLARGRVLGVIHVGSLATRIFSDEEADLLRQAAERAALGLERALLHDRLVALDRVRNRFVAVASHELRTPAAAILGSALTLRSRSDTLSPADEAALKDTLAEQAERLAALLEQLLDLSRIEADAVALRPARHRVRDLVEATLAEIPAEQRPHVEISIDPGLEANADRDAFGRIVANLVSNALRHGQPPVRLTASVAGSGRLEFVVEDAGAGVPPELAPRVFDEFVRADVGEAKGTGLGLAIARSYAQAQGGDLFLDRNGGAGARFRLVLPPG